MKFINTAEIPRMTKAPSLPSVHNVVIGKELVPSLPLTSASSPWALQPRSSASIVKTKSHSGSTQTFHEQFVFGPYGNGC